MMSRPIRLALAVGSIVVLGWIDYQTGPEYGFSLFYLIPIIIIGWNDGAAAATVAGAAASVAWFTADYLWSHTPLVVTIWNGFTRLMIYVAMGLLMSRLRQERERLQKTNEELEAFTYSVSHDLRAPLLHIGGFGEKLRKRTAGALDEEARRYVSTIIDSAADASRLIDDLLDFSRLGRSEIRRTAVDLNALVREVRADISDDLQGRDIHWDVQSLPTVSGDPAMLRVAIQNLIANAVKYTSRRQDALIEIASREENGHHVVFVRDNGAGFNPQYKDKLFGVFERLHDRNEFEGSGIGLAIAERVISRHGGKIWAEGEVDRGATFYIALPVK